MVDYHHVKSFQFGCIVAKKEGKKGSTFYLIRVRVK